MHRWLVAVLLVCWPVAGSAAWREAKTPHFLIYSQGTEKSLRERARRLEAVHYLMLRANSVADDPHPYLVRVYVVPTRRDVWKMMEKPDQNVGGFYRPRTEGPVAFIPEAEEGGLSGQVVLFHEYGHHFMLQNFPVAYPPWYVEGFAELVSTASFEQPGKITYGKVADHRSYEFEGRVVNARDMLMDTYRDKEKKTGLNYGDAWLLTHYLTRSPDRAGQLRAYLTAVNRGATPDQAMAAFGDLGKLSRDVSAYLTAANFSYVAVPIPDAIGQNISVRTLGDDENALLPLEMEFTKPMAKAEAQAFLARVERETAAYPNSVYALTLRAEVELDSDAVDRALVTTDQLLAAAPQSARAHYWKGAALLAQARAESGDKATTLQAARHEIVAANKLDSDDPLPLIAFYHVCAMTGTGAANAVAALTRAQEIVPQDNGLRMTLVSALIGTGDKPRAIRLLRPLAYSPHRDEGTAAALKMLQSLEGGAPPAAAPPTVAKTATN